MRMVGEARGRCACVAAYSEITDYASQRIPEFGIMASVGFYVNVCALCRWSGCGILPVRFHAAVDGRFLTGAENFVTGGLSAPRLRWSGVYTVGVY